MEGGGGGGSQREVFFPESFPQNYAIEKTLNMYFLV